MSAKRRDKTTPAPVQNGGSRENPVLQVSEWITPATHYPLAKDGRAEIVRSSQARGYYLMEGVDGYLFYYANRRIPVTALAIDGEVVMTDDPLHWVGMQRLAEESSGNVLVIGLGLGLVIHALLKNDKVTKIDVVEIDTSVIRLIGKHIPEDPRLTIYVGNGFDWRGDYQTVIVDILVRSGGPTMIAGQTDVIENPVWIWKRFCILHPSAKVYLWGLANREINPAFKGEGLERELGELHRSLARHE